MSGKSRTSNAKVLRPWIPESCSDQCTLGSWFCFPVRRDLSNGTSRFESKKTRNFINFFNHNLWLYSSNTNFSISILIGWLGPCVGGQFFYSDISSTEKWRGFILKMGGGAYGRFWKIIKQELDYFSVSFYATGGAGCNKNFMFL